MSDVAPEKVHLRGLDDLTTEDLKLYSLQHFHGFLERVEWIDDTSANLVYDSPVTASNALNQLTVISNDLDSELSPLDLRQAKPLSSNPGLNIQVRIALITDRKRPRAHETSRFYLMHPEHDPRERRRRGKERDGSTRDYRRRRYSDEGERRLNKQDLSSEFDASMYDDNGPSGDHDTVALVPAGRSRRVVDSYRPSRDRSSSPQRQSDHSALRSRRRTPPSDLSHDTESIPLQNRNKELFPQKNARPEGKDLFSNKLLASKIKKDLFPHKIGTVNHRRTDAFDAADETADLFAGKMTVPFTDGTASTKRHAERIARATGPSYGRLNASDDGDGTVVTTQYKEQDQDLNIRGASSQGFSIKGGASHVGTIKELFPGKANMGKELFAEKLKGRGGPRTKAADLFC